MEKRDMDKNSQSKSSGSSDPIGQNATAQSIAPFLKAPHAVWQGQPVRIAAVGDLEGFSPAYLVVDQMGQSQWQRQSDVTIVDPDFLPVSREALQSITDSLSSGRSGR